MSKAKIRLCTVHFYHQKANSAVLEVVVVVVIVVVVAYLDGDRIFWKRHPGVDVHQNVEQVDCYPACKLDDSMALKQGVTPPGVPHGVKRVLHGDPGVTARPEEISQALATQFAERNDQSNNH